MRIRSGLIQTEDYRTLEFTPGPGIVITPTDDAARQSIAIAISTTSRNEAAANGRGIITESFPIAACAGSTTIPTAGSANGSIVCAAVALRAGETVTSLACYVTTVGTSLTFVKLGLYDSAGNFLRATAESSASFNAGANAYKVINLTSAYPVTTTGIYYIAYLQWGSGATGATLVRGNNITGVGAPIGAGARQAGTVATQTDLAAGTITIAAADTLYWLAAA